MMKFYRLRVTPAYLQFSGEVFWVFWHLETRTIDTFKHIQKNTTFGVVEFAVACFAFVLKK